MNNSAGSLLAPFFREWFVQDTDDGGTPQYFGLASIDGNWYIMKIEGSTIRYALPKNNEGKDYSQAWTDRATLTYGYIFE